MKIPPSQYDWLEENLQTFFVRVGVLCSNGIISAHGDKCSSYRDLFSKANIPFTHGVAIYLLTYCLPYSSEVRETADGRWVDPSHWVVINYDRFKDFLPPI